MIILIIIIIISCRYMYFTSLDHGRLQISRTDMDGKNKVVLATLKRTWRNVDLALDKPSNRLFFSDQDGNVIRYIDLVTTEIHTPLSGNLHRPTSLTMMNNTLYWTAAGDGRFTGAIFKAEATNGSTAQMIADGFSYPSAIYAHTSRGYKKQGRSSRYTAKPPSCQRDVTHTHTASKFALSA